jgi:hypothetical protein
VLTISFLCDRLVLEAQKEGTKEKAEMSDDKVIDNDRLLAKAHELAAAANAATGSEDFNAGMLSVYSSVENNHGEFVVIWTANLGKFSSNGGARSFTRALADLEDKISRYASTQANG